MTSPGGRGWACGWSTRCWTGSASSGGTGLPANGLVLPPLLVDGRIAGYWRASGSGRRDSLEVVWFAGTRRSRRAELDAPVAAVEAGWRVAVTGVGLTREQT